MRRMVVLRVVAIALGALMVPYLNVGVAHAATTPSFDWTMPERFTDGNGDGLLDYVDGTADTQTGVDATPGSWRVRLNACASSTVGATTFSWRVIDQPDPLNPITVGGGSTCGAFFMDVPEEGAYRVELQVHDDNGDSAWVRKEVVVQDFLIVSLGDSYGSGEGSPDKPLDTSALTNAEAKWQEVNAAIAEVTHLRTSTDPLQQAVALWQAYVDELAGIDCLASTAAAARCTYLSTIEIPWWSGVVFVEAAKFTFLAALETIGDIVAAVQATIAAAEATVNAARFVAKAVMGELSATWQHEQCHRSGRSGSALAARQIEAADPRTSVTFVHLACSGATMAYGLLGWYEGVEPPSSSVTDEACNAPAPPNGCVPPQIDTAKAIVGSREVDAAYVSIGGNDAHFADIIIACILQEPCSQPNVVSDPSTVGNGVCPAVATAVLPYFEVVKQSCTDFFVGLDAVFDTATQLVDEGVDGDTREPIDPKFPGLAVGYSRVKERMTNSGLLPAARSQRMFLSHYVDAVRSDNGGYCHEDMGLATIPGLSSVEAAYVDSHVVPKMFGAIETATTAAANNWTFVDGVFSRFTNHGYCAASHFLVRVQETFLIEGRYQGMVHPNYVGHEKYRDAILEKLQPSLYPGGAARRPDQAVFAHAGGPYTVTEGSTVGLVNETWDSDGDAIAYSWTNDQPTKASLDSSSVGTPTLRGIDDTAGTLTLTASDPDGSRTDTASYTVVNAPPVLGTMTAPLAPQLLGTSSAASVAFSDGGVSDTHTGTIDWGDGTTTPATITESAGSGVAGGTHAYAATGIYTVVFNVSDDDGAAAAPAIYEYVVVYDPAGGFATGGGWFDSPSGAYTPGDSTDLDVVGRAHFGFVSKYQKGRSVPEGNTSFRFQAADLDFSSTSYEWMVISGTRATYRGAGEVNGTPGFAFQLSASDGGTIDKLRVRIWNPVTGFVVYDNQAAAKLDSAPSTLIGGGAIAVKGPR